MTAWLDRQHLSTLYLTTITVAELRYGIAALPNGRRKRGLSERFEDEVLPLFAGRVLPFDEPATAAYAQLQAKARAAGRPLPAMDALIAAICVANRHALATRNVTDFEFTNLELINPWT
ncbi:MAG: type II toxin-antitoxin system VapC family toxin [Propionicimonas sp.]|nr:type II toxin-antitoxin system VapC family toxin [Propionicimonas sp.]